jgi:hypothetical protein
MTPAGIPGVTTEPSETGMRSRRSHRMHPKAKLSIRRGPEFGFQCWRHKGSPTKIQGEPLLASADRWSAMLRSFLPGYSIKRIVMSTCAGFLSISATEPAVQALAGERKTEFLLPSRAVDTHVHIFDPSGHPYAATRSYSPSASSSSQVPMERITDCCVIHWRCATARGCLSLVGSPSSTQPPPQTASCNSYISTGCEECELYVVVAVRHADVLSRTPRVQGDR